MRCTRCGNEETKVLESRLATDGRSIRRRRICRRCDRRYTTYEREEEFVFHIKKRDGHIEPYQRQKAFLSIQVACRKRNTRIDEIEFMLSKVENKLQELGEKVVGSRMLGDLVLEHLNELDPIAYVRFASVYKDFKDPSDFYTQLKPFHKKSFVV